MAIWLVLLFSIAIPWLGAILINLVGDHKERLQHNLASAIAVIGGVVSLGLLPVAGKDAVIRLPIGGVFGDFILIADGFGVYLAVIAAVVGGLAVIFSRDYMHGEHQLGRYYSLTFFFIGAMIGLVLSGSLLFMFLFWEITAFCSYALISFHNDDPKAVAGGIKALIITQFGGVGLLAGALLAYTNFGSYEIADFLQGAQSLPAITLSLIAFGFLIAAAAKSAQVPFHTWLPDAMEAPTPISALIHAATMVNAGVYLLARFYPAFQSVPGWTTAVMIVGLISALLAAVTAIFSKDLKRTLAYSTISQLGYMVYAIGAGSVLASQFHLLSHSVFKALLFLGAGAVIHALGTRDMTKMGALRKSMPFVYVVFIIGTLALAGLPLTNGFFSKELVLEAGLEHGPLWAYIGMLIGAGLTGLYSLRMVWLVFYGETRSAEKPHDAPVAMRVSLGTLAIGTLLTWLLAGPFTRLLSNTLPFHEIETEGTWAMVAIVIESPQTWLAVALILLISAIWFRRTRLNGLTNAMKPLIDFTQAGSGFEWINKQIVNITTGASSMLSLTQTGTLSWNVVGILGGLILLLALVVWGG
jgi:NADH-quinone oxidoreductase subunit L